MSVDIPAPIHPLIPGVSPAQELALLLDALNRRQVGHRLESYWPYPKQAAFHAAGALYRERLFSAANQVGKTQAGAYEVAMHVTGRYPAWWKGRRFTRPNHGLAGSESGELTKKGVVRLLLGRDPKGHPGTGAIPRDCIIRIRWGTGIPDLPDSVQVKHESGGTSTIHFKSYDQGRTKWQADTVDWVWFDEEPPLDVYSEGLTRTNVTLGPIIITFTPLLGMSTVVKRFWIEKLAGTSVTVMSLYEAEHYSDAQREAIVAACPEHEKSARIYGIPGGGAGLIYPVDLQSITEPAIEIPPHWKRINGIDFGWDHPTAVVFCAHDADNDVIHIYDTHRQSKALVAVHASAIKRRGAWIPCAWPPDGMQEKGTGVQLATQYRTEGVAMLQEPARFIATGADGETEQSMVSVEAGISRLLERMRTGRLKVAAHLGDWFEEAGMYRRKIDPKTGRITIVKVDDDLMDATRYAEMMLRFAVAKPPSQTWSRPPPDWRA
jgi:phage terminase large subunit-like protein